MNLLFCYSAAPDFWGQSSLGRRVGVTKESRALRSTKIGAYPFLCGELLASVNGTNGIARQQRLSEYAQGTTFNVPNSSMTDQRALFRKRV